MKTILLEEIDSTNNYVKSHLGELEHLSFVYAKRQTAGRGRLERKWIDSGEDNLFLTIVIKPIKSIKKENQIQYANFTQYLSVVLSMVLEEHYKLNPTIKWPNDVLIGNKKIAGILAEGIVQNGEFSGLALGIGINLNTKKENLALIDKPATSIYNETGCKINREDFLEKLYSQFCLLYDNFISKGFSSIKEYYESKFPFRNEDISINVLGNIHQGSVERITDEGALVLKEGNKENVYYIGDIL